MSTQIDPAHNLVALLIGTGEFNFAEGAISAANARAIGFLDFGNIVAFTPSLDVNKQEHVGSYRGVRRIDKTIVTQNKFSYKLTCDEWNLENIRILFGADDAAGHTQAALSAVVGETLGFTAVAAKIGRWYDLRTSAGLRLRDITTATIATKVEGTDFVLDLKLARVKFLTTQAADLVPTITCPALAVTDEGAFFGLTPGQSPVKSGYGNLVLFDQHNPNKVVLQHENFSCDVSIDSASAIDGTGFTEISMEVLVTGDLGRVLVREANQNVGVPSA